MFDVVLLFILLLCSLARRSLFECVWSCLEAVRMTASNILDSLLLSTKIHIIVWNSNKNSFENSSKPQSTSELLAWVNGDSDVKSITVCQGNFHGFVRNPVINGWNLVGTKVSLLGNRLFSIDAIWNLTDSLAFQKKRKLPVFFPRFFLIAIDRSSYIIFTAGTVQPGTCNKHSTFTS